MYVSCMTLWDNFAENNSQKKITCSNSTKETIGKDVKYFKVNNKDTRTTSMASFYYLYG